MVTTPVYFLQILGNPTIEISQDELRSLLGEIETELHRSRVYRRTLGVIQKLLGDSSEQAQNLLKALGREAIGLAFRQFAQQYQKVETVTDTNQATETTNEPLNTLEQSSTDTLQSLKIMKSPTTLDNLQSNSQLVPSREENSIWKAPLGWFKNQKLSQTKLAKQAAQERIDSLRQIGQKLQQTRQFKGLSLYHIHFYTHIQMRHLEPLENGNWEALPEDIYVRGFIRRYGDFLGLDGTALAACLPIPAATPVTQPFSYPSQKGIGLEIRPTHLYVSYAALLAGAVGGLAVMSQQQANANKSIEQDNSSHVSKSSKQQQTTTIKPGIKSSHNGITVGSDIAPPEGLY